MNPYVTDLIGVVCKACRGAKPKGKSFCARCYYRLPRAMRMSLYRRVGEGYEAAFDAALARLKSCGGVE